MKMHIFPANIHCVMHIIHTKNELYMHNYPANNDISMFSVYSEKSLIERKERIEHFSNTQIS